LPAARAPRARKIGRPNRLSAPINRGRQLPGSPRTATTKPPSLLNTRAPPPPSATTSCPDRGAALQAAIAQGEHGNQFTSASSPFWPTPLPPPCTGPPPPPPAGRPLGSSPPPSVLNRGREEEDGGFVKPPPTFLPFPQRISPLYFSLSFFK
jgi:hypothetical protein